MKFLLLKIIAINWLPSFITSPSHLSPTDEFLLLSILPLNKQWRLINNCSTTESSKYWENIWKLKFSLLSSKNYAIWKHLHKITRKRLNLLLHPVSSIICNLAKQWKVQQKDFSTTDIYFAISFTSKFYGGHSKS